MGDNQGIKSSPEVPVEHHAPCPFHPVPGDKVTVDVAVYPNDIGRWRVRCIACGAYGPVMNTKAQAWEAWDGWQK